MTEETEGYTKKKIIMAEDKLGFFDDLRMVYRTRSNYFAYNRLEIQDIPSFRYLQSSSGLEYLPFYPTRDALGRRRNVSTTPRFGFCEANDRNGVECPDECVENCPNRKVRDDRNKNEAQIDHVHLVKTPDRGIALMASVPIRKGIVGEFR